MGWIDQLVPVQRSANAPAGAPEPVSAGMKLPTAVHALADQQDTPDRLLSVSAAGRTVGSIDQPEAKAAPALTSNHISARHATAAITTPRMRAAIAPHTDDPQRNVIS